jgi:hypothetical protein
VDGLRLVGKILRIKQRGRIVKFPQDSYHKFKGKVRENQLEGKIMENYYLTSSVIINIFSDDLTFEGKSGTHNGQRKTLYWRASQSGYIGISGFEMILIFGVMPS